MKYHVVRINKQTGEKQYYKNKCVEAWSCTPTYCWRFSKQGAKGIAKRYNESTHPICTRYTYTVESIND